MVDWVEEVQQISIQLHWTLYHMLREAQEIADDLKREGALT